MTACWVVVPDNQGWGDYGRILLHGMAARRPRVENRIQLERTAPYVPPLTLPHRAVVVTESMRTRLEAAASGAAFAPVDKAHIASLDWRSWDLQASRPNEHPRSGEPEDYVLERPHDVDAAARMPTLFEVVPQELGAGAMRSSGKPPRTREFFADLKGEVAPAFFRVAGLPHLFVSAVGRDVLASCDDPAWRLQSVTLGPLPALQRDTLTIRVGEAIPDGYAVERRGKQLLTGEDILILRLKRS
jgi:hypothetical protein